MSRSPIKCGGDTIPNTPEPSSNQDCIFARLTPVNSAARQNFDHAVDAIKENPTLFAHAWQNMCIEPARQASLSAASVFTDTDACDNEAASADASHRSKENICSNSVAPPRSKVWILGDGRGSTAGQINFLLAGPRRAAEVAGIHAMIFPAQRSCRLVLGARDKTIVPSPIAGGTTLTSTKSAELSEVEPAYETEIRIGPCVYLFQYDEVVESKEHQEQVRAFMRRVHGADWGRTPEFTRSESRRHARTITWLYVVIRRICDRYIWPSHSWDEE